MGSSAFPMASDACEQTVGTAAALDDYDGSLLCALVDPPDDIFTMHVGTRLKPHELGALACTSTRVRAHGLGARATMMQRKHFYTLMHQSILTASIGSEHQTRSARSLDIRLLPSSSA